MQRLTSWLLVRCSAFQHNLLTGDVRRHRFLSNPTHFFLTKMCSFTGHVVAKPATNFKNKREEHSAELQKKKKHENTTALKKTRNAPPAFSNAGGIVNWHPLKLCCYNEKKSTIQRHRGVRSLVASCRTKTIYVNFGVISMFSRITSDKTCPIEEYSWSRNGFVFFFGVSQNKKAATHVPVGDARTTTVGVLTSTRGIVLLSARS